MPASVSDVALILVFVLPGFLSYRAAVARSPHPSRRSTLWQLSGMLEYSVYIHVVGVVLFLGMGALLGQLGPIELHYSKLTEEGIQTYVAGYGIEALLSLLLYFVYVIVMAELLGAYRVPNRVAEGVSACAWWLSDKARPVPAPRPANPEHAVWYDALHEATAAYKNGRPQLLVRMKSGDTYIGDLESFPIVADDVADKDFSISHAVWQPSEFPGQSLDLALQPGGGIVLINTVNVGSIQVFYR